MHHFLRLVPPEWGNKDLSESSSSSRSPCSKVFPIAKSSGTSGRYPKQWHLPQWRRLLQRPDVDFIEIETCVPSAWGHRVRRASSIGAGRASPFLIILHFVRLCSASVRGFRRRTSMWRSRAADRGSLFPDAPEQESMHPTSCGPWWRLWSILWWGGGKTTAAPLKNWWTTTLWVERPGVRVRGGAWGRATEEVHRNLRPLHGRRDGEAHFCGKILVDDMVLIEPMIGLRPWVSSEVL